MIVQKTDPRTEAVSYSTAELREKVISRESITELLRSAQQAINVEIRQVKKELRSPHESETGLHFMSHQVNYR